MRKLAIAVILAIFVVYMGLAHSARTWYDVPQYEVKTLRVLGGISPGQWRKERFASQRYERLSVLESERYQLAEPVAALGLDEGRTLTMEDYESLVADGVYEVEVKDPAALLAMADKDLMLRHAVEDDGTVVGRAGEVIDKALLDDLIAAGVEEMPVVGAGQVVGFNATVLMVILIFVGMVLVLQEIFWDPMIGLLDKRLDEIREGVNLVRKNQEEATLLETERQDELRRLHHEYQQRLREERRRAFAETDGMMNEAHAELRQRRSEAEKELRAEMDRARESLREDAPAFTRAVRESVGLEAD